MTSQLINIAKTPLQNNIQNPNYKTEYREETMGRTTYCVTSVFTGEKDLGATLERLAVQKVLEEINEKSKELLQGI